MGSQRLCHGRSHCHSMLLAAVWRLVCGLLAAEVAAMFATIRPLVLVECGVGRPESGEAVPGAAQASGVQVPLVREENATMADQYDLIILGAGLTAFAAALTAQESGKTAVMTEACGVRNKGGRHDAPQRSAAGAC